MERLDEGEQKEKISLRNTSRPFLLEKDSHLDTSQMDFYYSFTKKLLPIIFHISIRRRRSCLTGISNYIAVIVIALTAVAIQLNLGAIYLK